MKRSIILLFVALPILAMAQMTPEAVIGLCPQLPSVAQLAALDTDATDAFCVEVNKAIKQAKAASEKYTEANISKYKSELNASYKKQYGKSADEFAAMSESERQNFAEGYAKKQLQSIGINKSISEIGQMSQAQKQAMGLEAATNLTGLTASDLQKLQKMENMSDEQALAYLQQTGMLGKVQNMGTKLSQTNSGKPALSSASPEKMAENMKMQNNYNNEVAKFISSRRKSRNTLNQSARELYQSKYSARIESLRNRLGELSYDFTAGIGNSESLRAQMKSLQDELDNLNIRYRSEIAAPWLDQVLKEMAQIKSLIPSARLADAANEEMMRLSGQAVYPQQEALMWAMEYLSTAASVTEFNPSL